MNGIPDDLVLLKLLPEGRSLWTRQKHWETPMSTMVGVTVFLLAQQFNCDDLRNKTIDDLMADYGTIDRHLRNGRQ